MTGKTDVEQLKGIVPVPGGSTVISDLTIPARSVANVIVILDGSVR